MSGSLGAKEGEAVAAALRDHPRPVAGQIAADDTFSAEFLLAIACCRWPPSQARDAAVRDVAARISDWAGFLRVLRRQRVVGLANDALSAAGIDLPSPIAQQLASLHARITRRNLLFAAEAIRLQRLFDAARIPALLLKGTALAQLAYGSLTSKESKDIDFLVPREHAEAAMRLLEGEGYAIWFPAKSLSEAQRRAVVRYSREVAFHHADANRELELQWCVADNPFLLRDVDARSATQNVPLLNGVSVRTLAQDDLFAYLCIHGAYHSWSRLKWLADLNAFIAASNADVAHLYRHAQRKGAGLCAAQALLLCHRLLDLRLPAGLAVELQGNRRAERLVTIALSAMTSPQANTDATTVSRNIRTQFLLGQGWAFFAKQCQTASIGITDVISLPLPPALHFLYPFLRLPLWLWRRATATTPPLRSPANSTRPGRD